MIKFDDARYDEQFVVDLFNTVQDDGTVKVYFQVKVVPKIDVHNLDPVTLVNTEVHLARLPEILVNDEEVANVPA